MKAETIAEAVLPSFLEAFEHLVKCNFNSEVHRALALFLTYSFHSPSTSLSRTPKPLSAISRASTPGLGIIRRSTPEVAEASAKGLYLTKKQLGKHVLGMFSRLLCEKDSTVNIKRFARTVTNKVWFLFPSRPPLFPCVESLIES